MRWKQRREEQGEGGAAVTRRRLLQAGGATVAAGAAGVTLAALGVAEDELACFPEAFRQGMAARAQHLGDVDDSAPDRWVGPTRRRAGRRLPGAGRRPRR